MSGPIRRARLGQLPDLVQIPGAVVPRRPEQLPRQARLPRRRPRPPPGPLLQTADIRQGPRPRTGRRPELAQPRIPDISSCTPTGWQLWSLPAPTPQIVAHYGGCMCSCVCQTATPPSHTDPPVTSARRGREHRQRCRRIPLRPPPCAPVPRLSRSPRGTHLPARGARVRATHPPPRRSMTAIRPPRRINPARRSGKDRSAGGQTPASTLLKRRTAPITVFVHRVSGLPGCWVVVMFNHLACAGAACGSRTPGRAGRPGSGAETDRASAVLPAS